VYIREKIYISINPQITKERYTYQNQNIVSLFDFVRASHDYYEKFCAACSFLFQISIFSRQ